jgi:signal transduction histidine kinase
VLATILVGLLLAVIATRRITRPIVRLKDATRAVALGHLGATIEADTHDEIGELARAFNRMSTSLRELDRQKEAFISYISHELRTPLASLAEAGGLLLDEVPGALNPKQRHLLEIIRDDGDKILRLINDLLDLARLESGMMPLKIERWSVGELVRNSLEEVGPLLQKKNQRLHLEDRAPVGQIWADGHRIQQVLTNLLTNAIKFTPEGGAIGVTVAGAGENALGFAVWDTGIGIDPAHFHDIFEKFRQVRSDVAAVPPGSGLGLPIARQIVEVHGGRIWVESEPGEGATFRFTVPVGDGPAASGAASTRDMARV